MLEKYLGIKKGDFKEEIKDICEYIDVPGDQILLKSIWKQIIDKTLSEPKANVFGKTKWQSYALVDLSEKDNGNTEIFKPFLDKHQQVHPDFQFRSTGFNFSDSVEKELYVHTDLDPKTEHPNYFNIVYPVFGASRIDYYETRAEEIWLPYRNARKEYYYHEFKHEYKWDLEHNQKRQMGHITVDKPCLIDTDVLHGVQVLEAPRLAFVVRYNNIPKQLDFRAFKKHAEKVLNALG